MVNPILDLLLQEEVITQEGYDNVTSKDTRQNKMRELYTLLNSGTSKDTFYKGLEEHEKCLLVDLCPQPSLSLSATQPKAAATSVPDFLVKTQKDTRPITHYQVKLKTKVKEPFACVPYGTVEREDKKDFECYTRLTIARVDDTEISMSPEVTQRERKNAGQEIQLSEIFTHPSGQNKCLRTVMSIGEAGVGKTFLVHKHVSDWAKKKKKDQDPHLTFVLQFRHLNLFKGQKFSLAQLIHKCNPTYECISEEALNDIFTKLQVSEEANYDKSPCKVQFVLDGFDENHINLDFQTLNECSKDLSQATSLEALLVNLINGRLLRCAQIWITTRPAAAKQIPDCLVDMVIEVKGFTDEMKDKYITKRIGDEKQASRIIKHVKASKNLHIMCDTPVFCSIIATVLQDKLKTDERGELPKTLAEIYSHFIFVQTKRKWLKHGENKKKLAETDKAVLLKLGRLAFEHLLKGRLIFYEDDLDRCHLDIKEGPVDSGLCTEIFKPDSKFFQETVYCFVHLSIQEFLAAVYLFDCFTQKNMEVLKAFLNNDDFNSNSSLSDFLKAAMKTTLQSKSGHLDLFVRFLHGISLESNQRGLGGLLGQIENSPEEIQKAITNLNEMDPCSGSPDRCINIFQCLMEMKAHSVSQGIQRYLESGKRLSETQCSALVRMLQMSEEVLEELDLQKCNTSKRGRWDLVPAVRNCTTARLGDCDLKEIHIEIVASALSSNPSHLKELDLNGNTLEVSGLELISDGLKSPHCCLDILRLKDCWLSERCCEVLSSALTSNPSLHLRELDVSQNMVTESGMKMLLSAGLKNLTVTHGGEDRFNPHLIKGYYHPLTLDTNTAHCDLYLSEDNRKVTHDLQDHQPPHPDRFDEQRQVLCSEGLTGRCYWEVEWEGLVSIAVTDRGISRKGVGDDCRLGHNDMSWSLDCIGGNSYTVRHNSEQTDLPVSPSKGSNRVAVDHRGRTFFRVAVYLDCSAGTLSFYQISEDILIHLYTFRNTFTEPLYAGFRLEYIPSSVFLCEQR